MTRFISIEELKQDGFINKNLEEEYLFTAIDEAQLIWLKEILGDKLYDTLEAMKQANTLSGIYGELMNDYIKIYLKYKVCSLLCVPLNFKLRNAGVVTQYSNEMNSSNLEDTKFIESFYSGKADFFANRLTRFLELNKKDIPEYKWCCKEVTNPNGNHPVCSIYLGR